MRIATRLDHVAIAADNTDAMVKWYEEMLGLVVHVASGPNAPQTQKVYLIGPPAGAAGGILQGMMIEVMPRNETARHERNSHEPGISHVAWAVADFDAARSAPEGEEREVFERCDSGDRRRADYFVRRLRGEYDTDC